MRQPHDKAADASPSAEAPRDGTNGLNDSENTKKGGYRWTISFFALGLMVSLAVGWGLFPKLLYSRKQQPLQFNHQLHTEEAENGCESCHYFREDGSFSGIPTLEDCKTCHEEAIGESEAEAVLMTEYIEQNREIPWYVYARQPDCVFFSHAAHVKMGEMACETCHGPVGDSEQPKVYEQNRITGYSRDVDGTHIAGFKKNSWDRMKMADCAECHETKTGRRTSVQTRYDACFVCHK